MQDLFDSVRFGLPGMISENGVADYGMLEYGSQVVRDASNTMLGLLHLGQFELAQRRCRAHLQGHGPRPGRGDDRQQV